MPWDTYHYHFIYSGTYTSCAALDDAVGGAQAGALVSIPSLSAVAVVAPTGDPATSCLSVLNVRNGTMISQTCSDDVSMHNVMFDRGTNRLFVTAYYTVRAVDVVYEVISYDQSSGKLYLYIYT